MKTFFKILIVVAILVLLSVLLKFVSVPAFIKNMQAKDEAEYRALANFSSVSINTIPSDYSAMFANKNVAFKNTLVFVNRSPVSQFNYENKYDIQICKLDTLCDIHLNTAIIEQDGPANKLDSIHYAVEQTSSLLDFYFNNSFRLKKPNKIYLTINGSKTKVVKSADSVACFYTELKNLSIQHDGIRQQNLYATSADGEVPTGILFVIKHQALYLLTMTPKDKKNHLDPLALCDLINP